MEFWRKGIMNMHLGGNTGLAVKQSWNWSAERKGKLEFSNHTQN
jgi:hypothetical protein